MKMYYVYFARGYANEEMIAKCRTYDAAIARADEEFANGARDIEVYDANGVLIHTPSEDEFLVDFYAD
jgi:hypothetical protein